MMLTTTGRAIGFILPACSDGNADAKVAVSMEIPYKTRVYLSRAHSIRFDNAYAVKGESSARGAALSSLQYRKPGFPKLWSAKELAQFLRD
ncbi:hypothetical protein KTT_23170 [Tengunoibacter tsumagoiensis]|uniref:Uncharacterized protein n=1 Tax=Tengunoibacter tsumagoiensis TaxID=2014871 RepID=A0A402A000_9CHLR|nr:hypothetical protein KTT_23170 [Tengunoibacter tsumagoiensis]